MKQFTDDMQNYFSSVQGVCNQMKRFQEGYEVCAIDYFQHRGIMPAFTYTFKNKYNKQYTLPIVITNYSSMCYGNDTSRMECLREQLKFHPVLSSVCSDNLKYITPINAYTCEKTHEIVITDVCQSEKHIYIEYQNSWGINWGECNGFGYIEVSNNDIYVNTRKVLDDILVINMDITEKNRDYCNQTLELLVKLPYAVISFIVVIILVAIIMLILLFHRKNISVNKK
jgi:hypothetical protein